VHSVVAAVIALVAGGLAIYTQWPHNSAEKQPTTESAVIGATVKPGLTFGQFIAESCVAPAGCGTYSTEMKRMRVVSVAAHVSRIIGYRGKDLLVVWGIDEADASTPVGARKQRHFTATLDSDQQALQPQWLPLPNHEGRFVVEVTLVDPATRRKITATCTPVFIVSRSRPGAPLRGSGGQGKPHSCS
jgi:hypothetical protein